MEEREEKFLRSPRRRKVMDFSRMGEEEEEEEEEEGAEFYDVIVMNPLFFLLLIISGFERLHHDDHSDGQAALHLGQRR